MNIKNIKVGDTFKNYKELCRILDEDEKANNSKIAQLKMWENYFSYDRKGQKITITEIYDKPLVENIKETYKTFKHGMSGTKIYNVWRGVKSRCISTSHPQYKDYGGRGIKICEEWLDEENGFINFYNWAIEAGYKQDAGLSIDRIEVDGDYEPDNCRWTIQKIQTWNRRNTIYITPKIPEAQKAFMNKTELIKYLRYLEDIIIDLGEENKIIEYKNVLREKGLYTDNVEGKIMEGLFENENE